MLKIQKIDSFVALIFGIFVKFLDLLFLAKFKTILLVLQLTLSTSLLSVLNVFKIKFDNPIVFNNKVNSAAILLKP